MRKEKIIYNCAVTHCKSSNRNNVKLFAFPRDETWKKWADFCKSPKISKKSINTLHRYYRICEKHFDNLQFNRIIDGFNTKLKPNVIPTLNSPDELKYGPNSEYSKILSLANDIATENNSKKTVLLSEKIPSDKKTVGNCAENNTFSTIKSNFCQMNDNKLHLTPTPGKSMRF